jgi:hypothetical protein
VQTETVQDKRVMENRKERLVRKETVERERNEKKEGKHTKKKGKKIKTKRQKTDQPQPKWTYVLLEVVLVLFSTTQYTNSSTLFVNTPKKSWKNL